MPTRCAMTVNSVTMGNIVKVWAVDGTSSKRDMKCEFKPQQTAAMNTSHIYFECRDPQVNNIYSLAGIKFGSWLSKRGNGTSERKGRATLQSDCTRNPNPSSTPEPTRFPLDGLSVTSWSNISCLQKYNRRTEGYEQSPSGLSQVNSGLSLDGCPHMFWSLLGGLQQTAQTISLLLQEATFTQYKGGIFSCAWHSFHTSTTH